MFKKKKLLRGLLCAVLTWGSICQSLTAQSVGGRVFRDFNANGSFDSTATLRENGQASLRVRAYDRNGANIASAMTDYWGNYSLNVGTTDSLRIEFDSIPSSDFASAVGSGNGTAVQFVGGGATNVNLGINYPPHYSEDNPKFLTPCYINGATNATGINDVLIRWSYSNSGAVAGDKAAIATKSQIGSTWGVAYARSNQRAYVSAFVKRHCGLLDVNRDSLGDIGNIYMTDLAPSVPTTNLWLDLTTLGLNFGSIGTDYARGLGLPTAPSHDASAVAKIAKIGIGGIDLSDDDSTLFVVNLFQKKIHAVHVSSKTLDYSLDVPNPNCTGGDYRPFAVKFYKNKLYVGVVCDAQTSQTEADLTAFVYCYENNAFTQVLTFPLGYARQLYFKNTLYYQWLPWRDVFDGGRQPFSATISVDMQPILADIEFDPNGDGMILALVDREGHTGGSNNFDDDTNSSRSVLSPGDILYAYKSGAQQWTIESGGDKDGVGPYVARADQTTTLVDRQNGATEFFRDDMILTNGTNTIGHREILAGGLAVMALQNRVDFIALDPLDVSFTGGTKRLNCYDGKFADAYQIYQTSIGSSSTFSKANGLGDLELIAAPQPIEIGNRVWVDVNKNGIQDAQEAPLSGVVVELVDSTTNSLVERATTNTRGEYYFSTATKANAADSSAKHNLNLTLNHPYKLQISNISGNAKPAALNNLDLTTANSGTNDGIDNDAVVVGSAAVIHFRTGLAGQNNHSLDFGFFRNVVVCKPLICLSASVVRQ